MKSNKCSFALDLCLAMCLNLCLALDGRKKRLEQVENVFDVLIRHRSFSLIGLKYKSIFNFLSSSCQIMPLFDMLHDVYTDLKS